jgi:AraC family transcriptional regulator
MSAIATDENSRGALTAGQVEQDTLRCGLARSRAERAIEYIDANLGSTLRVDEIAKFVGLTASHFSRAFKVSRGLSPVAYISRMRVDRAKCMIRATRKPLCQIAGDCGFADQSHLSRSFRRWVGASPAAWRRLVRPPRLDLRR